MLFIFFYTYVSSTQLSHIFLINEIVFFIVECYYTSWTLINYCWRMKWFVLITSTLSTFSFSIQKFKCVIHYFKVFLGRLKWITFSGHSDVMLRMAGQKKERTYVLYNVIETTRGLFSSVSYLQLWEQCLLINWHLINLYSLGKNFIEL